MVARQILHVWLLVVFLNCGQSMGKPSFCEQKETLLTGLDIAKDAISKATHLYPNCTDEEMSVNNFNCSKKSKSMAYLNIAMNLISSIAENYPPCPNRTENEKKPTLLHEKPMDCSEVQQNGHNRSGVYTIWPRNGTVVSKSIEVYCDMDTDGGGWVVIQRRGNFSELENFFRNWTDYKLGFGDIQQEFWLGNDNIFFLTNQGHYSARFDVESTSGKKGFAVYETFWIEDGKSDYKLHIQDYTGDIGDSMTYHDNMKFATYDVQYTLSPEANFCANYCKAGWWFNNCFQANLNGLLRSVRISDVMSWDSWPGETYLAAVEIKIRPRIRE